MVRVGGGWMALDEFLMKNDPCRGKLNVSQTPTLFCPTLSRLTRLLGNRIQLIKFPFNFANT